MIASPHRISPSSTVSESCCPWYGHNAFGTSLISSDHPATIMSAHGHLPALGSSFIMQVDNLVSSQHRCIHD